MLSYEEIIEGLNDEKVINLMMQLGADRYRDTDNAIIFPTICHNEDASEASDKLYYYKDTHLFYCYTEEGPLSIFKFLKEYYDTRQIAYDWYRDILQVVLSCSASSVIDNPVSAYKSIKGNYEPKKNRNNLPSISKGLLDVFVKSYPIEWLEDSISREAMDKYNILYSISQNKIIIPHLNADGELVGIRGRALNEWDIETLGKYMPVQIEGKWYSHPLSLNLYGLYENKDEIKKHGVAFIFESEKSVLQMESFDGPHCGVASCGSNINKFQIDLLMRYCQPKEIIVCFDNEEVKGESKYFDKLYRMCKKYTNYCKMSFIYDRHGLSHLKDSPSDNGQEIFNTLLRERIKIK